MSLNDETSHRVTITDLYRQGEDIRKNLAVTSTQTAILLDRSNERDKQIDELERRVGKLDKAVYWIGIPLAAIAGGTMGWDLLKAIL